MAVHLSKMAATMIGTITKIQIDCAIYLFVYLFIQSLRARDLTSFTTDLQAVNYYSTIHYQS